MTQADQIRQFILNQHIKPARLAGRKEVTLRAGDIHSDMHFTSRMPAVCSVLEGSKLSELASISIRKRFGPPQGANVYITFDLNNRSASQVHALLAAKSIPVKPSKSLKINPGTSLVLVSCVKSKTAHAAPAKDLYTSALFHGGKALAMSSGAPWFILSSKYGLVKPDEVIQPYEYTLNTLGIAERKAWAKNVLQALLPAAKGRKEIIILAGVRYREFLIEPLKRAGHEVLIPMLGLRFGEQLSWLAEHTWTDK